MHLYNYDSIVVMTLSDYVANYNIKTFNDFINLFELQKLIESHNKITEMTNKSLKININYS